MRVVGPETPMRSSVGGAAISSPSWSAVGIGDTEGLGEHASELLATFADELSEGGRPVAQSGGQCIGVG